MEMCRACLSTEQEMVQLNEDFIRDYNTLTNLNIMLCDQYPQYSCKVCVKAVKFFMNFRDKCIASETMLKDLKFENVTNENKTILSLAAENIFCCVDLKIESDISTCGSLEEHLGRLNNDDILIKNEEALDGSLTESLTVKRKKGKRILKKYGKNFKSKKDLKMESNKKEKKVTISHLFSCGLCNQLLEDQILLDEHLELHKKDTSCRICMESFNNWPQMLAHRMAHSSHRRASCHLCPKRFAAPASLEHHYLSTHYEGEDRGIQCRQCFLTYETPRKLRQHTWYAHSTNTYICDYCSKIVNTKQKMVLHLRSHSTHKSYVCEQCGYESKYSQGLKNHKLRKHSLVKFYCKTCQRLFANQQGLDKHACKRTVRVCPVCGKQFFKSNQYSRHLRTHRSEKRYQCTRCPAVYRTRGALAVHLDRHDGNRTKACEFCDAKFYSASVLIKHRRVHTGEKPYVCKVCQKGFTGNHNLKVHMKVHGEHLVVKKIKEPDVLLV